MQHKSSPLLNLIGNAAIYFIWFLEILSAKQQISDLSPVPREKFIYCLRDLPQAANFRTLPVEVSKSEISSAVGWMMPQSMDRLESQLIASEINYTILIAIHKWDPLYKLQLLLLHGILIALLIAIFTSTFEISSYCRCYGTLSFRYSKREM